MAKKVVLLIIDPQFDFCDPTGKLSVKGADKDVERLAKMVTRCQGDLYDITVTLDSHRTLHIAHPIWWVDAFGNHPNPFTLITEADVVGSNPKWKATNPGYHDRSIEYVQSLQKNGRYVLCIWPPHCLIGSDGYKVQPVLFEALCAWENARFGAINFVTKGSNMFTEHYSAVQADVPDPEDLAATGLQTGRGSLISQLADPDVALIGLGGEASSHCLASTARDIANNFGEENIKKITLIEDACSPVPGFENNTTDFINEMVGRGMKVTTSDKFLR